MSEPPLVEELDPVPDVGSALAAFSDSPHVLLLDSSLRREPVGRYSFLTADPFEVFEIPRVRFGDDPFAAVRTRWSALRSPTIPELPPFQGGAAGLLTYELGGAWERLPVASRDEFELPQMLVGLYDWVVAWDHAVNRAWILSHGFPGNDAVNRRDRAGARLRAVRERLQRKPQSARLVGGLLSADCVTPQFPVPGYAGVTSNFARDDYLHAVERVIESIFAGDIFQANLSQRLLAPWRRSPLELYERLRRVNPAPFSGYFAGRDWAIASASPERFVSVRDGVVETRPIKGTRKRKSAPEADLFTRDELRESEKDQAENVMIVDLLRNDLSRVCAPGTISVPHLCAVESYETVQHLVSVVRGMLDTGRDAWDLLPAVFPGGSVTGAPKIRAMEIIAELEPTVRGPYCGSLFYVGFDGNVDSNILIRTFTCRSGWVQFPVGGGIVAASDPKSEYDETLHKAEGMLRALFP